MLLLRRFAVTAAILLTVSSTRVMGQEAGTRKDDADKPVLTIGSVTGQRGMTATVPLYYKRQGKPPLRSLRLEIEFVSASVKFAKGERGLATEGQDYELSVTSRQFVPEDSKLEHTRISLEVSAAPNKPRPLPEGLLAYLNFEVPAESKPAAISLKPVSASAQSMAPAPVALSAEAGIIVVAVEDAPGVVCYFFGH